MSLNYDVNGTEENYQKDACTQYITVQAVGDNCTSELLTEETAAKMIEVLDERYMAKSALEVLRLKKQIQEMPFEVTADIETYLRKFNTQS